MNIVYGTLILHANLQYAEIPKSEIPNVVNNSYIPVISELIDKPKVQVAFNFTGVTLEILSNEYHEVIDLLKEGIKKKKFELTGCGYSHPIFPLLPINDIKKQIEYNEAVLKDVLNYKPTGFWLPELAYDPTLPRILKEYGYSYIFIDDDLYSNSEELKNIANPYNYLKPNLEAYISEFLKTKSLVKKIFKFFKIKKEILNRCKMQDFYPIELKGVGDTITGIRAPRAWFVLTYSALMNYPTININTIKKMLSYQKNKNGLIVLYAMDLEFFGYRSYVEGHLVDHKDLGNMLSKLVKNDELKLILPSDYLQKFKPKKLGYMRTGSWAPYGSLDIWTQDEDNKKLERLCNDVRIYLNHLPPSEEKEKIWKLLLLAENSDGRGWDPIPERRLDCFSYAVEALNRAKKEYENTLL